MALVRIIYALFCKIRLRGKKLLLPTTATPYCRPSSVSESKNLSHIEEVVNLRASWPAVEEIVRELGTPDSRRFRGEYLSRLSTCSRRWQRNQRKGCVSEFVQSFFFQTANCKRMKNLHGHKSWRKRFFCIHGP